MFQEDMKQMPRVATFLKSVLSYHTTYPTEKEASEAKKQPKVSLYGLATPSYMYIRWFCVSANRVIWFVSLTVKPLYFSSHLIGDFRELIKITKFNGHKYAWISSVL